MFSIITLRIVPYNFHKLSVHFHRYMPIKLFITSFLVFLIISPTIRSKSKWDTVISHAFKNSIISTLIYSLQYQSSLAKVRDFTFVLFFLLFLSRTRFWICSLNRTILFIHGHNQLSLGKYKFKFQSLGLKLRLWQNNSLCKKKKKKKKIP